jgi:SSS family solute:Na+ symporter
LILAAILAAAMSSISSDLNSISTVITRDYFQRFLPGLSEKAQLLIGRLMVLLAGLIAAGIGILLMPSSGSAPLAERVLVISVIVSAGTLGIFCLGFLTTRASRRGCYMGIAACVLFTLWGVLSDGASGNLDFNGYAFSMNPILIGVFGNIISFGVGYLCSMAFGGYRPDNVRELTLRASRLSPEHANQDSI